MINAGCGPKSTNITAPILLVNEPNEVYHEINPPNETYKIANFNSSNELCPIE